MERLLKYWVNINRISSRWSQTLTRTQVGQKLSLRWKYKTALRFEHHASSTSNIFYLAQPQGQGHHNSVSQLLSALITYPTLSTFPVGGNRSTRRKPTTFGRALTTLLHMRTGFESTLLGIELRTLEVKGEWSECKEYFRGPQARYTDLMNGPILNCDEHSNPDPTWVGLSLSITGEI